MTHLSPGSRKMRMCVIQNFLLDNDVVIKPRVIKSMRNRTKTVQKVTEDAIPTKTQLREILSHGSAKARSLFLMAVSSGARISELLQLTPNDIDFNSNPVQINIRAETTKTREGRITFISDEAHIQLKEWLKERDDYLATSVKRCKFKNFKKNPDDDRIFPFDYQVAIKIWYGLLKKARLDAKDKISHYKLHVHTLRKYYRTMMTSGENAASVDVIETTMGHAGYIPAYVRPSPERQKKEYRRAMGAVTIFKTDKLPTDEKDKQIEDLKFQLQTMQNSFKTQEETIIQKVLETLGRGKQYQKRDLVKNVPSAQVFTDGSIEF
jgi:integrase